MRSPELIGRTRPVLIVTSVALSMISHAVRTAPNALRGDQGIWWGVFAVASFCSLVTAWTMTRTRIAATGALVVTAFTSRALAVGVAAITDTDTIGANTLLAVTAWLLIAYYGGIVFWHLVRDAPPESGRS